MLRLLVCFLHGFQHLFTLFDVFLCSQKYGVAVITVCSSKSSLPLRFLTDIIRSIVLPGLPVLFFSEVDSMIGISGFLARPLDVKSNKWFPLFSDNLSSN